MIPYGRQFVAQADIDAVVKVLRSDFLTQGPVVPKFEKAIASKCVASYAVAVNSATSALHIACLALDLGSNDWLWTSPNTFVASANCGLYCGAKIDFVDIDPETYNISLNSLREKLERAKKEQRLPKVLVPVHFAGQSCDMAPISELARHYGFRVVEDASHAIGGTYQGNPIGNCRYSDITVFSFHPVKIITTGEGGMALTNDPYYSKRLLRLRSHGITRDSADMQDVSPGNWYYEQLELGLNYRMSDMSAALGITQLERLEQFVNIRHNIANYYNKHLPELPLILPWQHPDSVSAWHLYVVQLDPAQTKIDRTTVFRQLREASIGVNVHYIPVHTQPYYRKMGFRKGDYRQAEHYYKHAFSLPIYAGLTRKDQDTVINTLRKILK